MNTEIREKEVHFEGMSDEEARAERKRRQRQAQEEFRLKQSMKYPPHLDKQELQKCSTSFDKLLMDIPTQDIIIEETGNTESDVGKRKSPPPTGSDVKRRSVMSRLDIV